MSHELRTPLNAVIGFSEVLLDRLFGELNTKQEEYLEDIRESGRHLLELLNDILDLSKVEAGKMELELGDDVAARSARARRRDGRERASRQGPVARRRRRADVDVVVADPLRLKQVILNLLTNAVKFTPTGGRIEAAPGGSAGEIHVSVEDYRDRHRRGRPAAHLRGVSAGPSVSERPKGPARTTLSKRIVELHGGRLWVESRAGHGSTFTFALPVGGPAHASSSTGRTQSPRGASAPTVLVVEDDPRSLELMTLYLRGRLRGAAAADAEQGLELARVYSRMRSCSTSSCPTWMGGICWRSSRPTLARRGFLSSSCRCSTSAAAASRSAPPTIS